MKVFIQAIPWSIILILCLTLGLAPFSPEPHLIEKLRLLVHGDLKKGIDILDFFLHGTPFIFLFLKLLFYFSTSDDQENE